MAQIPADWPALWASRVLVAEQEEGPIYQVKRGNQTLILKQRNSCAECLEHEWLVGQRLNVFESPHLVETLGYWTLPGTMVAFPTKREVGFLLLSLAKGSIPSSKMIHSDEEWRIFYRHLVLIVAELQQLSGFVHYDLHGGNTLVLRMDEPQTWIYTCHGTKYSIESPFHITIIDFGTTHINHLLQWNGIPPLPDHWYESSPGRVGLGRVPSVADYHADIAFCLAQYADAINYGRFNPKRQPFQDRIQQINQLLVANRLNPLLHEGEPGFDVQTPGFKEIPVDLLAYNEEIAPDPGRYWYTRPFSGYSSEGTATADPLEISQRQLGLYLAMLKQDSMYGRQHSPAEFFAAALACLTPI